MSLELTLFVVALAGALALLTARRWLERKGEERKRYTKLLVFAMVIGFAAGRALHLIFTEPGAPWVTWALGPLGMLALVELGPAVLSAIRTGLKVAAEAIGRRFGGGR